MKHYKPGQFLYVNDQLFRAKKRSFGCAGCDLNNVFTCPMVTDRRSPLKFNCAIDSIVLKRVS